MPLDHVGVAVSDVTRAKNFYLSALKPLGYKVFKEFHEEVFGLGDPYPNLWLAKGGPTKPPLHLAFSCSSHAKVDQFYAAALAAGGIDNGPPGYRTQYHPMYYGAFVLDPDGNNLEAVCHCERNLAGLLGTLRMLVQRLLGRGTTPAAGASSSSTTQAKQD